MKKIAVVGMGIIGGSLAGALTKAGYTVDGFSRSKKSIEMALEKGYIQKAGDNLSAYDVVFLAVPPKATLDYLDKATFKDGALVTDICGVKQAMEDIVYEKPRNYRYVGIHPMAGKETSGIASASPDLFQGANIIIAVGKNTQTKDINEIKEYVTAMNFGRIVECTAKEHDKKIALTSQLAHIVSYAYVKSPEVHGSNGFTGGSFQDMTRIAGVDENVCTPLYAYNRQNIVSELSGLIEHLTVYLDALRSEDDEALSNALKEGRLIRETIRRKDD